MHSKLEILRGRLTNTFVIYDYIQAADMIKHDVGSFGPGGHVKADAISIDGVRPMPFEFDDYWSPALDYLNKDS